MLEAIGGDGAYGGTENNSGVSGGGGGRIALYANEFIGPLGVDLSDLANISGGAGGLTANPEAFGQDGTFAAFQLAVPEPGSLAMFTMLGLMGFGYYVRRWRAA
jgi:hypothetical protein